jgi:hypothetical protein
LSPTGSSTAGGGAQPTAGGLGSTGSSGGQRPAGSAATSGERGAGLDRELDESLSEFDDRLRKEQDVLSGKREETAAIVGAREQVGGASGGLGGEESGGAASTGGGGSTPESGGSETADTRESSGGLGGTRGAPAPPGTPSGHDDDIVARQLREAAENEEDPELREKLWEEYANYKRGGKLPKKKAEEKPPADETEGSQDEEPGTDEVSDEETGSDG